MTFSLLNYLLQKLSLYFGQTQKSRLASGFFYAVKTSIANSIF